MSNLPKSLPVIAAALLVSSALPAPAQANGYITPYVGWFDFIDDEDPSGQFGLEYRMSPIQYGFRPTVGVNVTGDGSVYGYGGFHWDVPLIENQIYLVPNFVAGAYSEGDGKDLGSAIEFRSGIEVDYQLPNAQRIGIAFNHISNASIGDKNPGAETILINYGFPLNW